MKNTIFVSESGRIFLQYLTGFTKFAYRNNQYYFK